MVPAYWPSSASSAVNATPLWVVICCRAVTVTRSWGTRSCGVWTSITYCWRCPGGGICRDAVAVGGVDGQPGPAPADLIAAVGIGRDPRQPSRVVEIGPALVDDDVL